MAEPDKGVVAVAAVLGGVLAETQLDLLEAVWEPCSRGLGWPVWDYVARRLYRRPDPIQQPGRLFTSLPRLARDLQLGHYGLVWRRDSSTLLPNPEQQIGLSVAGLHVLRHRDERAGILADGISGAIAVMAEWERQLEPEWDREVSVQVELDRYLPAWTRSSGVTRDAFLDVLQREWAPVQMTRAQDGAQVTLRMYMAPYLHVDDAASYLDLIDQQTRQRPRPTPTAPLAIAHMLDYLSLTLMADEQWTHGPLLVTPNLRAAGIIVQEVVTDVDFRDRMSALAVLIETLSLPAPTKPDGSPDTQQKSLGRLEGWLGVRLSDAIARGRALDAVTDLRAVVRLRVDGQHPGSRPQREAAKARVRLGLPDVIFDWTDAWEIVRGRVVDALNVICAEVRFAE